ncbi:DUF732 domain-containing protein [Mycobacterium talmoniae]|nr:MULTISPECIES: DUF732 domain-containing protein [Mycobacterium]OHV00360.1 hypothetical protein BKN37_18090 [Mycobacterium talmoniae]TDH50030.1 DUF732 domain-containing protein [Mycobacterium eburneum]
MKRLLLLVSAAAMVGLAVPAHADTTGDDAAFLAALDQAGLSHRGAGQAIAAGQAVCKLMDGGLTPLDTVNAVRSTNPGFTMESAAKFTAISANAYCPNHL